MMMRNCFVREEGDRLIIGSGIFAEWLDGDEELSFGPTLTPWGPVMVRITREGAEPTLTIEATWRGPRPRIDVEIPGFRKLDDVDATATITLEPIEDASNEPHLQSAFAEGSQP
jgi:hypothetical protein